VDFIAGGIVVGAFIESNFIIGTTISYKAKSPNVFTYTNIHRRTK